MALCLCTHLPGCVCAHTHAYTHTSTQPHPVPSHLPPCADAHMCTHSHSPNSVAPRSSGGGVGWDRAEAHGWTPSSLRKGWTRLCPLATPRLHQPLLHSHTVPPPTTGSCPGLPHSLGLGSGLSSSAQGCQQQVGRHHMAAQGGLAEPRGHCTGATSNLVLPLHTGDGAWPLRSPAQPCSTIPAHPPQVPESQPTAHLCWSPLQAGGAMLSPAHTTPCLQPDQEELSQHTQAWWHQSGTSALILTNWPGWPTKSRTVAAKPGHRVTLSTRCLNYKIKAKESAFTSLKIVQTKQM